METLLIRRRRPLGETVLARPGAIAATSEGTAGAGRVVHALAELGVALGDVRQVVLDPDASRAQLDMLNLDQAWERVILGSHLINLPDTEARLAFLSIAGRHLRDAGELLLEHHPVDWSDTAEPTPATPGASLGMVDVRRHAPYVSAVSVYDVGGRVLRQPFTARVLSDQELDAVLAQASLLRRARLAPTWIVAVASAARGSDRRVASAG